jgi:ribose transport system substrate-binding protein
MRIIDHIKGIIAASLLTGVLLAACQTGTGITSPDDVIAPSKSTETIEAIPAAEEPTQVSPPVSDEMDTLETPLPLSFSSDEIRYQHELMSAEPENPNAPFWEQTLDPEGTGYIDTSGFKVEPPWHLCFSNASLASSWRVVGDAAMRFEVSQHPEIGEFTIADAQDDPEKQISDIDDMLAGDCDVLVVSAVNPVDLAPAVEQAAAAGIPVVGFDRAVNTEALTTFIHPIGGFAYGIASMQWLAENMGGEGNLLAFRIHPDFGELEARWQAASDVLGSYPDIDLVGVEFTGADAGLTTETTLDYLDRFGGQIDGIWTDYGGVSEGAFKAFLEYNAEIPPITGEDYNGWLKVWDKENLESIAPSYPAYQWRTPIIASVKILSGERVPREWILPQPSITADNLLEYVRHDLPDGHYAMSGLPADISTSLWAGEY